MSRLMAIFQLACVLPTAAIRLLSALRHAFDMKRGVDPDGVGRRPIILHAVCVVAHAIYGDVATG